MAFTISGSLGISGAGATVIVVGNAVGGPDAGFAPQACNPVVADGSGNFTTPALPANDVDTPNYLVIPILFGAEFSPFQRSVIITNANITGVNWSSALSHYSLVQGFSDTMQRANENPLTGWTNFSADDPLQIVSDAVEASSTNACGGYPTGFNPPADCYFQLDVVSMAATDGTAVSVRESATGGTLGYDFEVAGDAGVLGGVWQINSASTNTTLISGLGFVDGVSVYTYHVGDTLLGLIRGSNLYLFQRLVGTSPWIPLGAATSTDTPGAGLPGLEILSGGASLSDTSYKNIISGSVIASSSSVGWSPVDSRQSVKGFGPAANSGVTDAQGNVIYSAQKPPFTANSQVSDNGAIPPADSRKAGAPADDRGKVPSNSRVAPPFGGVGEP